MCHFGMIFQLSNRFSLGKFPPAFEKLVGLGPQRPFVRVAPGTDPPKVCEADIEVSTKLMYCERREL